MKFMHGFVLACAMSLIAMPIMTSAKAADAEAAAGQFHPLFDGKTLKGWRSIPRVAGNVYPGGPSVASLRKARGVPSPVEPEKHPAHWFVKDGYIVGVNRRSKVTPYRRAKGTPLGVAPSLMLGASFALLVA